MKKRRMFVSVVLALMASLASSIVGAMPNGQIFWTDANNSGTALAKVWQANLDGTDVQSLVTPGGLNPRFIALDVGGGRMYWTDIGRIDRANLDGSSIVTLVTGLSGPLGIALDVAGAKMYWTNGGVDRKIQRANLDGSSVEDLVSGLSAPRGLALDLAAGKMYWTDTDTRIIQRANLDGSGIETLVVELGFPQGIALDLAGSKMYWTDGSVIRRANLDGSDFETLISVGNPIGIALDLSSNKMYWTENQANKIQRANLDGSSVEDLVTRGLDTPWGIALSLTAFVEVDIDIKPGGDPNAVNPSSQGVIPVAVLGSVDFDATLVDFSTVAFGPGAASPVHDGHVEDVNSDGFIDMVFHFNTQETGIQCGDIEATLTGETFGGQPINSSDAINTVGCPAPVSVTYDFTQTFGNIEVAGTLTYNGIFPASITVEDLNNNATWDLSFSTTVPVPGPFPLDPFTLSDNDSSWNVGLLAGTTLQIEVSATELVFDLTTPLGTNAGMALASDLPGNFSQFGFGQGNLPGFERTEIFIQAVMDPSVESFFPPFDTNLSFPAVPAP